MKDRVRQVRPRTYVVDVSMHDYAIVIERTDRQNDMTFLWCMRCKDEKCVDVDYVRDFQEARQHG